MMPLKTILFLLVPIISLAYTEDEGFKKWPEGLERCTLADEDLDKCILEAAKQVLPLLVKGRKELELVSLDPLAMGNFTLVGSKGPISLRLELAKAQLAGQSALNLHSVKYDRAGLRLELEALHKEIQLTGDYRTQGKLFRVPINSQGTLLFSLSLALNRLLNDNSERLLSAFRPSMEEVVQRLYTHAFQPMFRHLPFDQILPKHPPSQPTPTNQLHTLRQTLYN